MNPDHFKNLISGLKFCQNRQHGKQFKPTCFVSLLFGSVSYTKKWLSNRGFIAKNVSNMLRFYEILYNKKLKWSYLIDVKNLVLPVLHINKTQSSGDLVVSPGTQSKKRRYIIMIIMSHLWSKWLDEWKLYSFLSDVKHAIKKSFKQYTSFIIFNSIFNEKIHHTNIFMFH